MTDREAIIDVMDGYSVEFFCKVDKNDCADEIIEMLKARGWMNDPVVVELGEQVKKLRKTCPNVELAKIMDWPYDERCSACNGTGYLPIGLGDIDLIQMVKDLDKCIDSPSCGVCSECSSEKALSGLEVKE